MVKLIDQGMAVELHDVVKFRVEVAGEYTYVAGCIVKLTKQTATVAYRDPNTRRIRTMRKERVVI